MIPNYNIKFQFSEAQTRKFSTYRIIQKNLVHFQGFPDRLFDKELLCSPEYFGQYGIISKIILVKKSGKNQFKKNKNNAYISFETPKQAAYAILSVDSIKIDNMLVRAFFGTTKYCKHFLNNFKCENPYKCLFLHYIADKNDIIGENYNFKYSEHINLAKKIIDFDSINSRTYVMKFSNKKNTVLPKITTIYSKNEIMNKSKNREKNDKNTNKLSIELEDDISTRNSSNDSNRRINPKNNPICSFSENQQKNLANFKTYNELYKSRNTSRFDFAKKNTNNYSNIISNVIPKLIDDLSQRLSFFITFDKNFPINLLEIDYCMKLYNKSKDEEIKKIINVEF